MTMSEKQPNWLPWILVAGLAYFAFVRQPVQPVVPDDNKPQPVQSVSKILDAAQKQDRANKIAILKEYNRESHASDEAAKKWFSDESTKRYDAAMKAYADIVGQSLFDNKTKELAERLEAGR
jgi:hypothetical protein